MNYPVITPEFIQARIHQWEMLLAVSQQDVQHATAQLEKWRNYGQEH